MPLVGLKVSGDEPATDETTRRETVGETLDSVPAVNPGPLPVVRARHLDVDKILERSLPRVANVSTSSPASH